MSLSTINQLRDGQVFGRYQIVRMLGEGGMGTVYEAIHVGLKKRFALKTLLPAVAKNPEAQTRFLREGEAASRISHPNVVTVTDVGTQDGIPYLVMEYLDGETLADYIERNGVQDVALTIDLLLPAISAVSAGHDQGVIHRDLKPHNIFLARGAWGDNVPKILDFGVSKILGGTGAALTGTLSVLGTASYMSPEQARGARVVDAASDQYAMGVILYEILTGTRAHPGEHPFEVLHRIASGVELRPRDVRPDLPPALEAVVIRMVAMRPEERYPSLREAGRALLPFATDKARANWAPGFDEIKHNERAAPPSVAASRRSGTLQLPDSSQVTQPPRGKGVGNPDTTLGQGARETGRSSPARSRFSIRNVAIGGVVVALALGLTFVARRPSTVPGPASGDTTSGALPSSAAEDLPASSEVKPPSATLPSTAPAPEEMAIKRAAPSSAGAQPAEPQIPTRKGVSVSESKHHRSSKKAGDSGTRSAAKNKKHEEAPTSGANAAPILD